jgi:hypothetical protein
LKQAEVIRELAVKYCHTPKDSITLRRWVGGILCCEYMDMPLPPGLTDFMLSSCHLKYLAEKRIFSIVKTDNKRIEELCLTLEEYLFKYLGVYSLSTLRGTIRWDQVMNDVADNVVEDILMKCGDLHWRRDGHH